jgi:hypothetical protein
MPRNVCYGSLADILTSPRHVRFTPITDVGRRIQVSKDATPSTNSAAPMASNITAHSKELHLESPSRSHKGAEGSFEYALQRMFDPTFKDCEMRSL